MRGVAVLVVVVLASGCGGSEFSPPARDAAVRAEEARTAVLVERYERSGFASSPGRCDVRVLGIEATTTYVWAACSWKADGRNGGVSSPFRVVGSQVIPVGMGSEYSVSIRRDFPPAMADAILERQDDLRPA